MSIRGERNFKRRNLAVAAQGKASQPLSKTEQIEYNNDDQYMLRTIYTATENFSQARSKASSLACQSLMTGCSGMVSIRSLREVRTQNIRDDEKKNILSLIGDGS